MIRPGPPSLLIYKRRRCSSDSVCSAFQAATTQTKRTDNTKTLKTILFYMYIIIPQVYCHLESIFCQSPSTFACNNDYQIYIMLLLLLTETLQMPKSKGDQRIWGLLAQSVEQVKKKSGRVENARTVRQREKDRLARLKGAAADSASELESATSLSGQGEDSRRAPVHRNEDSFTGERGDRRRAGAELESMGEEVNRQDASLRIASQERQGELARKEDGQVELALFDTF